MFDPIKASEEIKNSYIDYITTTFDIADADYASEFKRALRQEGMIAKGPYLSIGGSFETGHTLHELMDADVISPRFEKLEPIPEKKRELKLDRPLYQHQEEALIKAANGQSLVVTTGTGSGKTECFLLPILNHLLREEEQGNLDPSVRAIIIYPMNALANDQIKRMRALLNSYETISFGIYNGNTPHTKRDALKKYRKTNKNANGNPDEPRKNELISREAMQETPPHILITNYSMLEYMLLRPKDDCVFSGAKLKYIVLDEAHIYRGATGMETSMLMRRLRARISPSTSKNVQYILTSATLGGPDSNDDIVNFAEKMTGVSFKSDGIIRSHEKQPQMIEKRDVDPALFTKFVESPDAVSNLLKDAGLDFAPEGSTEEKLYEFFLHLHLFAILRQEVREPITVTKLHNALLYAAPNMTRKQVVDFISVCARAEKDGANLIKPRYHFFVRALEGAYITLNSPKQLFLQRKTTIKSPEQEPQEVFEAAICSDCGRIAIVGKKTDQMFRQSSRQKGDDVKYYLIRTSTDGEFFDEELFDEDKSKSQKNEEPLDWAVCPVCGAISSEEDLKCSAPCEHEKAAYVKLRLVRSNKNKKKQKNEDIKCPACSFGSLRRFYLGSEAATAVLGTELFEQLPTEKIESVEPTRSANTFFPTRKKKTIIKSIKLPRPQFLCFSDNRSEAAYFATYMERSYQEFLRRRGIWLTVAKLRKEGKKSISVDAFVQELYELFERKPFFKEWDKKIDNDKLERESQQHAWIAILNEMFSARRPTGLSSLGMLAFTYKRHDEELVQFLAQRWDLTVDEMSALLDLLVQDAVFFGALKAEDAHLSPANKEYLFFSSQNKELIKVKTAEDSKEPTLSGWCGRKRPNNNDKKKKVPKSIFYPNTRITRLVRALGISEIEADEFLKEYWDNVFEAGDGEKFVLDATEFDVLLGGTDSVRFYRCNKCSRITPFSVKSRCANIKCNGSLEPYEPLDHALDNHYARLYMNDHMDPLYIKEHTAQLAKDQQTRYQDAFTEKKINALSCSTTFEMGVDLGSLETVYLRDVPPTPSNYVQRAGRAGRGRGSAAFVMTYAKLSSHDFTYYSEPENMISGKISAPVFEVENEKILDRHVNAVAISAFFAQNDKEYDGDNQTVLLNEGGYERLKEYLAQKPYDLKKLLEASIPENMHHRMGIDDWSWVERLTGKDGTLQIAVDDFRETVKELEEALTKARSENNDIMAAKLRRELQNFRCSDEDNEDSDKPVRKSLISFLVRNNVLPKYGFPVDTVELLPSSNYEGKKLQLVRDLQMAIADYAPGAQVVADGELYTSRYIRKTPGTISWEYGWFCYCPSCRQPNFFKGQERKVRNCVSCRKQITKYIWERTLEPRRGFCVDVVLSGKPVPMHRPERDYKTDDCYIGDTHLQQILQREFIVNNKRVRIASTINDSLVVVGQTSFHVCPVCGYADASDFKKHKTSRDYDCPNTDGKTNFECRLSHDFKTDVARVTFLTGAASDINTMRSVLYAMLEGLSREMGIERTDIKGCLFLCKENNQLLYSVILYDAVAGGAGHVRRLVTEDGAAFQRVLRKSLIVVERCDCDTSCYKCLRNYYNQKIHDELDRFKAVDFLRQWIGDINPVEMPAASEVLTTSDKRGTTSDGVEISDESGMNMRDSSWEVIWRETLGLAEEKTEQEQIRSILAHADLFDGKEKPIYDGTFKAGEEYSYALCWPRSRVMIFTEEYLDGMQPAVANGWTCFEARNKEFTLDHLLVALKEE